MLRNFIIVALRNLRRNKVFSLINIVGLSVGVACCLLLVLYVQDELRYDTYHRDGGRVFRITSSSNLSDFKPYPRTSPPIAWGIKDEVPEFETVARIVSPPNVTLNLVRYEDKMFYEPDGYLADSTIMSVLTFPFIEGNPTKALTHPNSVVISGTMARKLFGNESALGKVLNINQGGPAVDFTVTGVMQPPANSHLRVNFFASMTSDGWGAYVRQDDVADEWAGQNFMNAYVKLRPGYSLSDVIAKMNTAFQKHGASDLKQLGVQKNLSLEPLENIYLYSSTDKTPRIHYLYVVGSIAAFILLIACINFMNLSTAKAAQRAIEVGLRKSLGAPRGLLIRQFLSETLLIVAIAMIISCMLVPLVLPVFNQLTGKAIHLETSGLGLTALCLLAITIITGLVAGSYPAFYLSSFQPAGILKGRAALPTTGSLLRRALVVFQFVIAITLVCGMIVISRQLSFMQAQDLGFDTNHKIVLPLRTDLGKKRFEPLSQAIENMAGVSGVTGTTYLPGSPIFSDFGLYPAGSNMDKAVLVHNSWVEPNYLQVMGISLIAGHNFPTTRNEESWRKVIVNEEAVRQLGLSNESIVGDNLYFDWQGEQYTFEVIGVMKDYHHISLREKIYPILLRVQSEVEHDFLIAEVKGGNMEQSLAAFESAWKSVITDAPFEYSFLDENIQKQYADDKRVAGVINTFTVIAMVISCLGLYGLSGFMAEKRFREIGVRKVLGASVRQIVVMMSGEFVRLVLIAFVLAVPLSLYGINLWLEGFAYKVSPDVTLFALAGGVALLIAVLTISFESIRAASGNPVDALRDQ
ncbi:ABC transporter permease [Parachryseolinea silvisoli]|uniref:ABC transporter permease n=1 Tax=Parachryseolinea silvisoli TaxID=2873601 RepID=UPI002265ED65|nr:ABC transporter permease [Parachryseolinea silvisoli]MCD9019271.1 ABC transporter permease [Parachryseolinea silvisoli]